MKIIRPDDKIPTSYDKTIFLAGPTPRSATVESWRPQVCEELKKRGYTGVVFVPERENWKGNYIDQIKWEDECLNLADCILFWVPRTIDMPAFTTNVEYGEWFKSGKIVLGFPEDAEKMRYLETKAKENFVPVSSTVRETVRNALSMVKDGARRKDGERCIPLHIWNTKSFQDWYGSVKKAGNRLDGAKVLWSFRVGKDMSIVFSWIVHADVYVTKEKRNKTNEFVFSRPDISTVCAYYPNEILTKTEILLIKEFRTPCSNDLGMVLEIPGGSSKDSTEGNISVAVHELKEEVGLDIEKKRFTAHQSRQIASTLSAHKAHLFSVELTDEEIKKVRKDVGKVRGVEEDTEKTYIELKTLQELINEETLDWSMLGMVLQALSRAKFKNKNNNKDWVGNFIG